ncbi:MAG: hypothetical protein WAM91_04360 [Candidatus Acidiferrales bacterium]
MRFKIDARVAMGAALCFALAIAGCKGAAQSGSGGNAAKPREDWGMSLLSGGTVGPGQFPAKFTFDITATPDCTNDFVVYNTSLTGASGTAANIMAFNELYSTQGVAGGLCAQNGPSVYWSYFTGTGQAVTSVTLSGDGKKVAFVETAPGGATLRILEWQSGEGTGAGTPANVDQDISGSAWSTCPAGKSCVVSIPFNGSAPDTNSAPFYDFNDDILYVGDDNGSVHKFTGVFNGTPIEVTTSWPIAVDSGTVLSGPVFDTVSRNLFVEDSTGLLSFILETGSTTGTCGSGSPPCLGSATQQVGTENPVPPSSANVDAPVVDGSTGRVLAFNGNGDFGGNIHKLGTVLQADTALNSINSFWIGGNGVACNGSSVCSPLYAGAFDNDYLNSSTPNIAGHMYACGKDNTRTDRPALYQFTFAAATGNLTGVGTSLSGLVDASPEACSPVTEIFNTNITGGAKDFIFFSVGAFPNFADPIPVTSPCNINTSNGDNEGCLISMDVTSFEGATPATWPPTSVTAATLITAVSMPLPPLPNEGSTPSSTSGIVVDNVADPTLSPQASSIYFSYGTNADVTVKCNGVTGIGCAVKLTQSALQ